MILPNIDRNPIGAERTAVETNVLEILDQQGAKTLDQLESELVHIGSAPLLFAIDRLSRSGRIAIGPPRNGDYLVWLLPESHASTRQPPSAPKNIEVEV
ncbi:hypothetical protein [Nitrospira sp. BLG_2]|uniref:hypothetical protein n=1 Tax=Nitrospira sp. BLG_2 TaxID=3397507 RepID=UPI003B9C3037